MFWLTNVLSGPQKLLLGSALITIMGFCLHWLFTGPPEYPLFATVDFVLVPGSWNFTTTSDTFEEENENGNNKEGELDVPFQLCPQFSGISLDFSENFTEVTDEEFSVSVTETNNESLEIFPELAIVVDTEFESVMEMLELVTNVETNSGSNDKGEIPRTNKKVGSETKKTVDASGTSATPLLNDSLPIKTKGESNAQAKRRRKNKAKNKGKPKARQGGPTLTEETWPNIETGDHSEDPEPEFFAANNPFSLLSGLDDGECQEYSGTPLEPTKMFGGISLESPQTDDSSRTIDALSSSAPSSAEVTSPSPLPIFPLNCGKISFTAAPTPTTETIKTIDDDGFDFLSLIKKRKRNRSPTREITQTLKKVPVLVPLRDTTDEWRKVSSPPRSQSLTKSENVAIENEWKVVGRRRRQPPTWAEAAATATTATSTTITSLTSVNGHAPVAKTDPKEITPNIVVLYKRKLAVSV